MSAEFATTAPLTYRVLDALGTLVQASAGQSRVAFLDVETGDVAEGTARGICTVHGLRPASDEDLRDQHLRITMDTGVERLEPLAELAEGLLDQTFFVARD